MKSVPKYSFQVWTKILSDVQFVTLRMWAWSLHRIAAERYNSIQFTEFNPILLMQTKHRINKERIYFFTREANKMDTKEEDILAIYIILINMVNAFTTFKWTSSFLYEVIARKKKIYQIFCFFWQMTNTKLLKGNRLLDTTQ